MAGQIYVPPLRKRRLTGELYTRDPKIEALLIELATLSRDELLARAQISDRRDRDYVPSECLVHIIRASRFDNRETWFGRLYQVLSERVLRSLPKAESRDGRTESLALGSVRDKVFGRFTDLLAGDRAEYLEKLDYFEVRFDGALASLRKDAQAQVWRDENRKTPLELDEETGEPSPEVEKAAAGSDPLRPPEIDTENYRLRLDAAIEALPREQSRIITMLRQGFQIDSSNPNVLTISKALDKSEKTVRLHRDKALATLRAMLKDGDEQ
jgi:hypothetical protein